MTQDIQITSSKQIQRPKDDLNNEDDATFVEEDEKKKKNNKRSKNKKRDRTKTSRKSKSKSKSFLKKRKRRWCYLSWSSYSKKNVILWSIVVAWSVWNGFFIIKFHPSKQRQEQQQKDQQHHPQLPSSESPPPISASETLRKELENFNRKNIPFTQGEDTGRQRLIPAEQSSVRLEFLHIPKTAGTAVEATASNYANISWGVCHFHFNFPPRYQRWEDLCPHDTVLIPKRSNLDNGNDTTTNDRQDIWPTFPEMIGWWHYPLQYLERDYISTKIIPVNPYTHTTFANNPQTQTINNKGWEQDIYDGKVGDTTVGSDIRFFTIIRNPFDRMVSEYYHNQRVHGNRFPPTKQKLHDRKLNDRTYMNNWIQRQLRVVMGMKKIDQKYSPFFTAVSTSKSNNNTDIGTQPLEQDPKYLYQHLSGHFIPQYDYIFEEYDEEKDSNEVDNTTKMVSVEKGMDGVTSSMQQRQEKSQKGKKRGKKRTKRRRRRRVHHVLKFENLTMEFNELMDYYGISLDLGKSTTKNQNDHMTRMKGRTLVRPSSSSSSSSTTNQNETTTSMVQNNILRMEDLDGYSRKLIIGHYYKDFLLGNYSMTID